VTARPLDDACDGLITLQEQVIAVLAAQNAVLAERAAQPEAANADLAERLAGLERAVSRNSGNSSMPQSADNLPGRSAPRKRWRAAARAEKHMCAKHVLAIGTVLSGSIHRFIKGTSSNTTVTSAAAPRSSRTLYEALAGQPRDSLWF
jgi:hypothetical protein